jgi:small subunit ribosomal protein S9
MNSFLHIAIGKRKTSIAKVRFLNGSGEITINGRSLRDYFQAFKEEAQSLKTPFLLANWSPAIDLQIQVHGGGLSSQLDAIRLGIAKGLCAQEPSVRPVLKQASFLRRDDRIKERRKYGLKKARKASQYSKR